MANAELLRLQNRMVWEDMNQVKVVVLNVNYISTMLAYTVHVVKADCVNLQEV